MHEEILEFLDNNIVRSSFEDFRAVVTGNYVEALYLSSNMSSDFNLIAFYNVVRSYRDLNPELYSLLVKHHPEYFI